MIPWNERVNMLSINPDAATRDDVALLAAENQDMERTLRIIERLCHDEECSKSTITVAVSECIKRLVYDRNIYDIR